MSFKIKHSSSFFIAQLFNIAYFRITVCIQQIKPIFKVNPKKPALKLPIAEEEVNYGYNFLSPTEVGILALVKKSTIKIQHKVNDTNNMFACEKLKKLTFIID